MTPRKVNIMRALEYLQYVKNECRDMEMARALFQINLAIELIHLALDIAPTDAAIEEIIGVRTEVLTGPMPYHKPEMFGVITEDKSNDAP